MFTTVHLTLPRREAITNRLPTPSLTAVQDAFNAHLEAVRVVALLSPT